VGVSFGSMTGEDEKEEGGNEIWVASDREVTSVVRSSVIESRVIPASLDNVSRNSSNGSISEIEGVVKTE
jgi:hypothetical protein